MKKYLKKMWPTATASLVALTSYVHADTDDAQMRNLDNRVTALEQRRGANGIVNPSARPQVKDGWDLFLTADLLYWEAHENGLDVALNNNKGTTFANKSTVVRPDFEWDFGFRVGLGYNIPHDDWDVSLTWLHFVTDGNEHERSTSTGTLFPTLTNPVQAGSAPVTATEAEAHWKLHLNQLDLQLGRDFYVSKWLALKPYLGLRSACIRQKLHTEYKGGTLVGTGETDQLKWRLNYKGLGLGTGLNSEWGLGQGWSIYGDAGISLLYGFFSQEERETFEVADVVHARLDDHYHITRAISDLAAGLRWDYHFFGNHRYHVRLQLGWEHHVYFGMNQFDRFVSNVQQGALVSNQGDLTLQGWTLSGRFDF